MFKLNLKSEDFEHTYTKLAGSIKKLKFKYLKFRPNIYLSSKHN